MTARIETVGSKNPFAIPGKELHSRLWNANNAHKWGIARETFTHLYHNVPPLPEGRLAFLSLRVRFGDGQDDGIRQTAEAHIAEIIRVFGTEDTQRNEPFFTSKERLRLLSGNDSHKPCVEWCVIDLDTHRERQSIAAVRDATSVADEGLALAWLYPKYVRAIDGDKYPHFALAGYEIDASWHAEEKREDMQFLPQIWRHRVDGKIHLGAISPNDSGSDWSVPSLRK